MRKSSGPQNPGPHACWDARACLKVPRRHSHAHAHILPLDMRRKTIFTAYQLCDVTCDSNWVSLKHKTTGESSVWIYIRKNTRSCSTLGVNLGMGKRTTSWSHLVGRQTDDSLIWLTQTGLSWELCQARL